MATKTRRRVEVLVVCALFSLQAHAEPAPKDAEPATRAANAAVLKELPFADRQDFEDAKRGFIANEPNLVVLRPDGKPAWDMSKYSFITQDGQAPDTVNPSLWRMAQLNNLHGLFKVTDRVYQVRGYDLSVISFIQGETGWIVIDPCISTESAKAALDLASKHLGAKPVVAVIYTHSHVDHFGGVKGVVSDEDVKAGKVKIIAPEGFVGHAISENLLAGNGMIRRATYMYGGLLPKSPKGQVDAGLGKTTSAGTVTLIAPTEEIKKTAQEMTVDGVKMVFQMTPGTEAPAEMNFYFPQFKALMMAENAAAVLHNTLTPRGALVRDPLIWAHYLDESVKLFGDKAEVMFTSHHWPRWGRERMTDHLKKQRDLYKYLNDQTLRLINQGYTLLEVGEMVKLPKSLAQHWGNREYYGTVNFNVKAIYQRYLGFFTGNPAELYPLPPEAAARKYVAFMGGADAVIKKARESFANGEYRWVAQVMNHVVFADPQNQEARNLEADALEQLGYQAESAVWRNFFLTGAQELRQGVMKAARTPSGLIEAVTLDMLFDYVGVRVNGPKADGKVMKFNFILGDTKETGMATLENAVLHFSKNRQAADADATVTLSRPALNQMMFTDINLDEKIASGQVKLVGNKEKLREFLSMLDSFEFWFNIVTP